MVLRTKLKLALIHIIGWGMVGKLLLYIHWMVGYLAVHSHVYHYQLGGLDSVATYSNIYFKINNVHHADNNCLTTLLYDHSAKCETYSLLPWLVN